jgi:membrane-associated protein
MQTLAVLGLDPRKLLTDFGPIGLFLIIFAESGLLVGFFLPGDSLLFTAGLLTSTHVIKQPLALMCGLAFVAAVLGDQVGYQIGKRIGPELFKRPKSKLFSPNHVIKAQEFFDKHGSKTIVLARFVPIIRTFTPVLAGVGAMKWRVFAIYNLVGGALWGIGVTLLGAALGKKFPWMEQRIDILAIVIVAVSVMPMVIELLRHRAKSKAT